jgi:hypothetical protein
MTNHDDDDFVVVGLWGGLTIPILSILSSSSSSSTTPALVVRLLVGGAVLSFGSDTPCLLLWVDAIVCYRIDLYWNMYIYVCLFF